MCRKPKRRQFGYWACVDLTLAATTIVLCLITHCSESRAGETVSDPTEGSELTLEVHPKVADFANGKAGRTIISSRPVDGQYWTIVPTTKANKPAQTADRKMKITAYVWDGDGNPKPGVTVTFEVEDPDPDDPSVYETNPNKGDNDEPIDKPGSLSANSDVTVLCVINGRTVAAAEVELTITNRYSGDNYRVKATCDGGSDITCLMTAWKRIYLERDQMYKKGATVSQTFVPDQDDQPDKIWVDDNGDFAPGDTVVFFNPGGQICEAKLIGTGKDIFSYIVVPDMNTAVSAYDGVKLKGNEETYANADLRYFGKCFGDDPRGAEHDGCFVEFSETGVYGAGPIPKYAYLLYNGATTREFLDRWFFNRNSKDNCFYLVCVGNADPTGWANTLHNFCVLVIEKISGNYVAWEVARDEIACHETGHQFVASSGHVDENVKVLNHDKSDYCIMSYAENAENGITEFCVDHCWEVRQADDPR